MFTAISKKPVIKLFCLPGATTARDLSPFLATAGASFLRLHTFISWNDTVKNRLWSGSVSEGGATLPLLWLLRAGRSERTAGRWKPAPSFMWNGVRICPCMKLSREKLGLPSHSCAPCHSSQPGTNLQGSLKAWNNMQCKWNLSHTTVLVPASFRRLPWEPRETGTVVGDALYHLQAQTYSTPAAREPCEKLVNPGPLRLECTFLGRKWLFPWKAQLPRVCMRSMEKVISSECDSECLSTGLILLTTEEAQLL